MNTGEHFFIVKSLAPSSTLERETAYLVPISWDDWFEFSTLYTLFYIDLDRLRHEIGAVKIGQFKMKQGQRRPEIPDSFDDLGRNFFSIGQDASYYEKLNSLGFQLRDKILGGLKDCAKFPQVFERARKERVTKMSLMRSVTPSSIEGQFRRLADGGAKLTEYAFKYEGPESEMDNQPNYSLTFSVEPNSLPPTNIHVLIGRNGVGKTHLLNNMINSLIKPQADRKKVGNFSNLGAEDLGQIFANLVSVSFSAFDNAEPLPEKKDKSKGIMYSYIGLKQLRNDEKVEGPKTPDMLGEEFAASLWHCKNNSKLPLWVEVISMLDADPVFSEADVGSLSTVKGDKETHRRQMKAAFKKFSSGHKIVLLTITRLVETVEERSLILLDEPEAHLHPPLLSAFIRALSNLLMKRNGVAIIATHSPVILQEVPRSCVWKLRRRGAVSLAERLELESFGENVGTLTREIFGLEVTNSGFHLMITEALERKGNYKEVLEEFENQLGNEARAVLQALIANQE